MRNRALLLSILSCLSLHTYAESQYIGFSEENTAGQVTSANKSTTENETYIDVTYHFHGAIVTNTANGDKLYMENALQTSSPGEPMLPYYRDIFLVPSADATIEELSSEYTEFDDIDVIPFHEGQSQNEETTTKEVVRNEVYQTNKFYPANAVKSNGVEEFREANLLYVSTYPVQTNPVTKKIRCYSSITYRIHLDYNSLSRIESNTLEMISPIISNKSSVKPYQGPQPQYAPGAAMIGYENKTSFVFITVPSLEEPTRKFAEWKTTMGFRCTVMTDPSWTKEKIMDSIEAFKKKQPINYLLIVGDNHQVPTSYIKLSGKASNGEVTSEIWTDKAYSAKEKESTTPIFTIGRISGKTSSKEEIEGIFNKIQKYESRPPVQNDFYKNALHISTFCDKTSTISIEDGIESMNAVGISEIIRNKVMGLTDLNIDRIYTKDSQVYPQFDFYGKKIDSTIISWEHNANDITSAINDGQLYVLYTGHGLYNGWQSPLYETSDAELLTNGELQPVIFSGACYVGEFASLYCLTESLISNDHGGTVGMVANTDAGFVYSSQILNDCVLQNLNPSNSSSIADIMEISILNMPQDTVKGGYEFKKHTFYSTHYFGDPSMVMYSAVPQCISPTIYKHNDSIIVELDNTAQYIVTLTSTENPMDMTKFKSFRGLDKVIFKGVDYPATICITSKNHIPYISLTDKYIQNMVFNEDSIVITGQDVYVGQEVTSSISKGKVICKGGNTLIQAQNTIHLRDGFKVNKGANFKASFHEGSCSYKVFEHDTPKFANYSLVTNNGDDQSNYLNGESWGNLTDMDENQNPMNQITLYPNPTDGKINVTFGTEEGEKNIIVTSISGAVTFRGSYNEENAEIDLSNEAPGVYFIQIITSGKSITKQIVKK